MLEYIYHVDGLCLAYDFRALIVTGVGAAEVAKRSGWEIVAQGTIDLALGVALFDRPFIFTPTRIITERQQTLEGPSVFAWLVEQGYAMPRSEVFGVNVRGRAAQVYARDIDLEASPIAVYDFGTWVPGLIEIDPAASDQLVQLDRPERLGQSELPEQFRRALKIYRAGPNVQLMSLLA